jgi:hypothetical protein
MNSHGYIPCLNLAHYDENIRGCQFYIWNKAERADTEDAAGVAVGLSAESNADPIGGGNFTRTSMELPCPL